MSDQHVDLALAFLQLQPGSAAAVLEQQPLEHVATFLAGVPTGHAAAVLRKMLPRYSALLCRTLDSSAASAILSELDISQIAAILRYCDKRVSKKVLNLLPESTKIACKLLLNYVEEQVGAWMVANIIMVPDDCNVGDARNRLAGESGAAESDMIYVVDRQCQLRGVLSAAVLLRAAAGSPVTSIMRKKTEAISGRASLVSALHHSVWSQADSVAVVNRQQQLVGMLRHCDLRNGLSQLSDASTVQLNDDPLSDIFEAYGSSLVSLLNTVGEIVDTKPHQPKRL